MIVAESKADIQCQVKEASKKIKHEEHILHIQWLLQECLGHVHMVWNITQNSLKNQAQIDSIEHGRDPSVSSGLACALVDPQSTILETFQVL